MFHFSVKEALYLDGYKIWLKFHDGKQGVADLSSCIIGEIFEPLKSISFFKTFVLERNTVAWKNGADFAPEFLYTVIKPRVY
jgi:hypothetical protein